MATSNAPMSRTAVLCRGDCENKLVNKTLAMCYTLFSKSRKVTSNHITGAVNKYWQLVCQRYLHRFAQIFPTPIPFFEAKQRKEISIKLNQPHPPYRITHNIGSLFPSTKKPLWNSKSKQQTALLLRIQVD